MTKDEALKLALDYIVESNKSSQFWLVPASNLNKTVNAIKEVLAQPEQDYRAMYLKVRDELAELQQNQPHRKPLTDEEIAVIAAASGGLASDFVVSVARAIEAAHGIKD